MPRPNTAGRSAHSTERIWHSEARTSSSWRRPQSRRRHHLAPRRRSGASDPAGQALCIHGTLHPSISTPDDGRRTAACADATPTRSVLHRRSPTRSAWRATCSRRTLHDQAPGQREPNEWFQLVASARAAATYGGGDNRRSTSSRRGTDPPTEENAACSNRAALPTINTNRAHARSRSDSKR